LQVQILHKLRSKTCWRIVIKNEYLVSHNFGRNYLVVRYLRTSSTCSFFNKSDFSRISKVFYVCCRWGKLFQECNRLNVFLLLWFVYLIVQSSFWFSLFYTYYMVSLHVVKSFLPIHKKINLMHFRWSSVLIFYASA
jgi:hypothetical protein